MQAIKQDQTHPDATLVISLQHAFSHWNSSDAREKWLLNLAKSCTEGTLLVFKEHYNLMNDDQLALNHFYFYILII